MKQANEEKVLDLFTEGCDIMYDIRDNQATRRTKSGGRRTSI